jgi:hypothetical protein
MPKQTVPDIQFGKFVIAEIPKLFAEQKILINTNYQRGDIWKQKQQIGLIKSISDRFSIGVEFSSSNNKVYALNAKSQWISKTPQATM